MTVALAWMAQQWAQEARERRFFLWLPVCFLGGVLGFLSAAREPSLFAPAMGVILAGGLAVWLHLRGASVLAGLLMGLVFLFAGFGAGALRVASVQAPILSAMKVTQVRAWIEAVEERANGSGRLLLRVTAMEGLAAEQRPEKIRVTLRALGGLQAGEAIQANMRLMPPAEAAEPGGYDFAREAFFQRIGAVGNIISRVERLPSIDLTVSEKFAVWIDRARNDLTRRIASTIGGDDGAVAAALVTGKRGLISEEANEALRGAGIYHVVSISGLHMVLAAGLFMWSLRAILSLFPALVLNWPVKKISALFAMLGATAYCLFAGAEVATERSLIMILVMLGAVLFDRPALSMRNLAVAALIVMAREPESVMGPSFQMSFAAVAAMVAVFERGPDDEQSERDDGWSARMLRWLGVMLLTTLVAGLATGPFASFHFHRINPYSMIGNALTLPLVEFIVMPAAVLGVVLGPFGLDGPVWTLMGFGISGMMEASRAVAGLTGSTLHQSAFGVGALLSITCGILFLCLWRSQIRVVGVVFLVMGGVLASQSKPVDLSVDARARSLALRGFDAKLSVANGRGNDFAVSQWLLADGDKRKPNDPSLSANIGCDPSGCIGTLMDGRIIALVFEPKALAEDCTRADILITRLYLGGRCKGPELVLDGAHFAAHGATSLRLKADGSIGLDVARRKDRQRAWDPQRISRFTHAPMTPGGQANDKENDPRGFAAD